MKSTSQLQSGCENALAANFALADSISAQHATTDIAPRTPGELMAAKISSDAALAASRQVASLLKTGLKTARQDIEAHRAVGREILAAADHIESGAALDHTNRLHPLATRLRKHVESGFDARSTLRAMRNSVADAHHEILRFEKTWLGKSDLAARFTAARLSVKILKNQYGLGRPQRAAELMFERVRAESDAHRKNAARKGVSK